MIDQKLNPGTKNQKKVLELCPCQLVIKGTFRHGRKTSKIRFSYDRKMIWPPFLLLFPKFIGVDIEWGTIEICMWNLGFWGFSFFALIIFSRLFTHI